MRTDLLELPTADDPRLAAETDDLAFDDVPVTVGVARPNTEPVIELTIVKGLLAVVAATLVVPILGALLR